MSIITEANERGNMPGTDEKDIMIGHNVPGVMAGRGGSDIMIGGRGNDYMIGNGGNDTMLGGRGNDTIFGSEGDDIIRGEKGNDYLSGEGGMDLIFGGQGNDIFAGDARRLAEDGAVDYIIDFEPGRDTIQFFGRPDRDMTITSVEIDFNETPQGTEIYFNGDLGMMFYTTSLAEVLAGIGELPTSTAGGLDLTYA